MPILLYSSNDLHKLSLKLSENYFHQNPGVFNSQYIITQTQGMNNWLKQRLAEEHGISANIQFMQPNDMIHQIYFRLVGTQRIPINQDTIQWHIYFLLDSTDFKANFPNIHQYYLENDIKRYALAAKTADLFDQYQVYRPEAIKSWNLIKPGKEEKGNWQQWLWIKIRSGIEGRSNDKTELASGIQNALEKIENQESLKQKYPLIAFFGIAVITPFYLHIFESLSKYIDLHFYLLNPSPEQYWMEDHSEEQIARITGHKRKRLQIDNEYIPGNSLLINWGKIIKDSFYLLFQNEDVINSMEIIPELSNAQSTGVLSKIQDDIYNNYGPANRNHISLNDLKDGSLVINSCFTPVREIEVLYNYLVDLIDRKKEILSPRDIIVIVSDINRYAPYIRAVFDNAPYKFPYTIADETIATGNNIFNALEKILNFDQDNFKAEAIMELLESPYIRKRFNLNDIDFIRNALRITGIRFGWEGSGEEETRIFSWTYGLDRILYGLCIGGGSIYDTGTDLLEPLDAIEGHDGLELIRLRHFVEVLKYYVNDRNKPRSLSEWANYIRELTEDLIFESGEKEDEDFHRLIGYLERILLLDIPSDSAINFEVFHYSFSDQLAHEKKVQSFLGGGITFCSLIPMRSIPFQVVSILGMDFDQFPRKESRLSFSLLEKEQKRGDRNVKDNDKHLFLETIISARKYLYISYIGNNPRDGTMKPPSSLVDELLDYILAGINERHSLKREHLITRHPLHGFSQRYFNDSGLITYLDDDKYRNIISFEGDRKLPINFEGTEIRIQDLSGFFKDPLKFYLNKSLNVYYREEEILLPETELFELNKLDEWIIRDSLVTLSPLDIETWRQQQISKGKLPLNNIGRIVLEQQSEEISDFRYRVYQVVKQDIRTSIHIILSLDEFSIEGKLESVYGDRYIVITTSSNINKILAESFVKYVISIASGYELDWHFIAQCLKKDYHIPKGTMNKQNAEEIVRNFILQYKEGFIRCYPFYTALTQPEGLFKMLDASYDEFIGDIEYRLNKTGKYKDHIVQDPYFLRIYENGTMDQNWYEEYQVNMKNFFSMINQWLPDFVN